MAYHLPRKKSLDELVCHWEDDGTFCQRYPALYQLLSCAKDGQKFRPGARLTFFCDTGRLKASIWDEHTQQAWYCTLEPGEDVLAEIEAMLQAGKGEWRAKRTGR